eukprot:CAMPEP_0198285342 /NCGR_PEP_ID=MMETSP1449-20131203/4665_1 /TAXON_ID=420275 /ORGANISM="Attheya septentrionalis, Strain CCMP2084" /LENGTH=412 /DNA_ID=CAMNT_0043982747 /DNA_START=83 /DNA_END=1321 /DNA_ORIENTATION=+
MRPQHLLLSTLPLAALSGVAAYVVQTPSRGSFTTKGRRQSSAPLRSASLHLRMDTEGDVIDRKAQYEMEQRLMDQQLSFHQLVNPNLLHHSSSSPIMPSSITEEQRIEQAMSTHGMPWSASIGTEDDDTLLYMPFWDWQMSFMKETLTNLRVVPSEDDEGEHDFTYKENTEKKARIVNLCFASDEYRKIRMSYYDAGDNTQVFNSVWYPDPKYNLPVLGIDLLAFNRKKYLAIVDFQPLHEDEADHAAPFEHMLKPIKEQYDSLKGRMSSKFYDETQFFSQEMLFARFEDESVISTDLMPAFQRYVEAHVDMLRQTEPSVPQIDFVLDRQQAYDTYSAERDPATGLFASMFGKEWADQFVYNFLFSMSEKSESEATTVPTMGGHGAPPSPSQQPQQHSSRPQPQPEIANARP